MRPQSRSSLHERQYRCFATESGPAQSGGDAGRRSLVTVVTPADRKMAEAASHPMRDERETHSLNRCTSHGPDSVSCPWSFLYT